MTPLIASLDRMEVMRAMKRGEILLYYQPLYNFNTQRFESVEALARWQHPDHGLLLPEVFLPYVDQCGLSIKFGDWVLKEACYQFKQWLAAGIHLERIAINIHGRQLYQKDFVDHVMSIIESHGLKPHQIEFELTEDIIIHDKDERLIQVIRRLKALGIRIALDDFGTGYSSISYLRKIPIDRIKIDKTYIQNMINHASDAAIVQAIITLACSLHLRVVAEGIESYPQLVLLLMHEGLEAQGFYFSRPLPPKDAGDFLRYYQHHPFPLSG